MRCATLFFPLRIRPLMKRLTMTSLYFRSGETPLLTTPPFLGISIYLLLGLFRPILGPPPAPILHPRGVQGTPHHMVAHPGQVFDPPPPDEDHGMFLEIVAHPGNIGGHLNAVGKPYP